MCSIYLTNIIRNIDDVKSNLLKIKYRGPNNLSVKKYDNSIIIGHLRLSIIDLDKRSNQPYEFEKLVITYNGEIYNYLELREKLKSLGYTFNTESDTEVILKGFHAWGTELLPKMNGMFAFAIYDSINKKVFCARDRLGQKPFYYYWNKGFLELCSSPKPMEKASKISQKAVSIYLETGYIPSPYSIYENVKKLEAGTFVVFDLKNKKYTEKIYWDLKKIKKPLNISYQKAREKLKFILEDAVKIRMISDVPLGSFLSGGIDSSIISSIANKFSDKNLKTFTVKFVEKDFDESEDANLLSKNIGTDHKTFTCNGEELISVLDDLFIAYDEPFSDPAMIPTLMLCKKVKNETTVCLSGDGGDESFLGYNHFSWLNKAKLIFLMPEKLRKNIIPFLNYFFKKKRFDYLKNILLLKNLNEFTINIFLNFISITKKKENFFLKKYYSLFNYSNNLIQKAADINIKLWLEGNSNVKIDRASMYSSIEVRNPFLDHRIIEFTRELPIEFKYKGKKRKIILQDILKDYVDEELITKSKKGFSVPISNWINGPLKKDIKFNLEKNKIKEIPNLNYKKVKNYLKSHFNDEADFSHIIWRVYVLKKWLNINL